MKYSPSPASAEVGGPPTPPPAPALTPRDAADFFIPLLRSPVQASPAFPPSGVVASTHRPPPPPTAIHAPGNKMNGGTGGDGAYTSSAFVSGFPRIAAPLASDVLEVASSFMDHPSNPPKSLSPRYSDRPLLPSRGGGLPPPWSASPSAPSASASCTSRPPPPPPRHDP